MKKFAVIAAAFMLSIALVVVQAEASADTGISQPGSSKIIHSAKAKTSFSAKHKKTQKNHFKAHLTPSFTGEQAKENTPQAIKAVQISTARLINPAFNFEKSESLARSNSYTFILKTRK